MILDALNNGTAKGLNITSKNGNTYTPDSLNLSWHGKHYASFTKGEMTPDEYRATSEWRIEERNN